MADKQLKVTLGADISAFQKAMGTVKGSAKDVSSTFEKSFGGMDKESQKSGGAIKSTFKTVASVIAGAFAVDKLVDFTKGMIEQSASAQALSAQFSQVFGSMEGDAQTLVEGMASKFGMLPNRVKPGFTQLTSMFKGVGMDTQASMSQSEQAMMAAADAAAFYDTSMENAQSSITSFLKGNYEAGESVGIFANDTQMAQFAISKGVVGSTAEWQKLDEATKMATRNEYIRNMQEQSGAMGQASREADGYENVMGNLKQAWKDFQAQLGSAILPTAINLIKQLAEWISNVDTTAIINGFKSFGSYMGDILAPIFDIVKSAVENLWNSFKDAGGIETAKGILDAFKGSLETLRTNADTLVPIVAGLVGAFITFKTLSTVSSIISSISGALNTLRTATSLANAVQLIFNGTLLANPFTWVALAIGALIGAIVLIWQNWDTVSQALSSSWNWIKETASSIFNALAEFFSTVWNRIATIFTSVLDVIKNIVQFAFLFIKTIIETYILVWQTIIQLAWNIIKAVFETVLNVIKSIVTAVWSAIGDKITAVMTLIKSVITTVWNAVKSVVTTVLNAIKNVVTTVWNAIKVVIDTVMNAIKSAITVAWNA
ncbi:hypothetical protein MXL49_16735, partial [Enterococcus casseliflavus]|nr:hypothetical protein [Enterococcus casseliflavus]